jgi:hypothetical protein
MLDMDLCRAAPHIESVIDYESPTGVVLVCLAGAYRADGSLSRPTANAAMWVERTSDDSLIFHCSHAEAPEPNFEGWVVGMTIQERIASPTRNEAASIAKLVP